MVMMRIEVRYVVFRQVKTMVKHVAMDNISQNQMTTLNQEQLETDIGEELDVNSVKPTDSFDF